MFIEHPVFQNPTDEKLKLWRYVDIEKFESLLKTSSLYFCRADKFKEIDPFEGTYPKLEYEYIVNTQGRDVARNFHRIMCNDTFINCWHLNQSESTAMWKLYTKENKGIAIQTSVKDFKNSFDKTREKIRAGLVQYVDYEEQPYYSSSNYKYLLGNGFIAFVHKRDIYKHEREYRAIFYNPSANNKKGFFIKVKLSRLINRIIVAPYTSTDEFKIIKKIAQNYLNLEPVHSMIEKEPYY